MGAGSAVSADDLITAAKMNLKLETVDETDVNAQFLRLATGSLAPSGQNAKIFSWQNTVVSADIVVILVFVDITTAGGAGQLDVGVNAAEATDNDLINGGDLTTIDVLTSNDATIGGNARHCADDEWVTGFEDNTGNPAGLIGKYYIYYVKVAS